MMDYYEEYCVEYCAVWFSHVSGYHKLIFVKIKILEWNTHKDHPV